LSDTRTQLVLPREIAEAPEEDSAGTDSDTDAATESKDVGQRDLV